MFEVVESLSAEHAELERRMADPALHADRDAARRVGRRYAELSRILQAYARWRQVGEDLEAAEELAAEDPDFAEEAARLATERAELERRVRLLLAPRDPHADRNAILEVKAGEGGEESALFAGDLLRMYERYAERRGWRTEILELADSDLGGVKSVTLALKGSGSSGAGGGDAEEPDLMPYARLKFEGGVHRVQRVPVTESQGRIHTSAAGVLVMPEAEELDVAIDEKDLRIDVFRSSGPGGQSVNTTDSAVRITHLPTGVVVSCQNEKSQLQNREQALRILRARLLAMAQEQADAEAAAARRSQVRTVDRSERVRTYNFPQNRLTDHRVGYTAYNLDQVIDGELDGVIGALLAADQRERLAQVDSPAGTPAPGALEPGAVEPGAGESGAGEPGAGGRGAGEPGAGGRGAVERGADRT